MQVDSSVFDVSAITEDVASLNAKLINLCQNEADDKQKWWDIGAAAYRKRREEGLTAFPKPVLLDRAKVLEVPSRDEGRSIQLRCFVPAGKINAVLIHIHGGGWTLSSASAQDKYLSQIADDAGVVVASIEYRLSPEHPSPAAENDCFDAAHYLFSPASTSILSQPEKVRRNMYIAGESAGAHLAALTMLSLRDKHKQSFSGAILNYGVFDLSQTPSARSSTVPLVLRKDDMDEFTKAYKPNDYDNPLALQAPTSSPLYAELKGLCRAFFAVGTVDCLLDDSLFMSARYAAAGNEAVLKIYPGAPHGFATMMTGQSQELIADIVAFLTAIKTD